MFLCLYNRVKIELLISPVSPFTLSDFKLILSYLYLPKSFIIFVQVFELSVTEFLIQYSVFVNGGPMCFYADLHFAVVL